MQQLLTRKKRLPGFSSEWEVKKLGNIGDCVISLTCKPENIKESGLLVLRSSNIEGGKLIYQDNIYVDIKVPVKLVTKEGDILIYVRNGSKNLIDKSALIDKQAEGSTFGAFMSMDRTIYSHYVFQVFQTHTIKAQINENMEATIN